MTNCSLFGLGRRAENISEVMPGKDHQRAEIERHVREYLAMGGKVHSYAFGQSALGDTNLTARQRRVANGA